MTRVLLIDDDANILDGLQDILEDADCEVVKAASCAQALERLSPPPAIVILDFNLPDGKGVDLAGQIRAKAPKARIVLMTGLSASDIKSAPDPTVIDTVLTKPIAVPVLLDLIRQAPKP
jgi:DNA-binding NtrC family response regulator